MSSTNKFLKSIPEAYCKTKDICNDFSMSDIICFEIEKYIFYKYVQPVVVQGIMIP
jgi:hypothetical protein